MTGSKKRLTTAVVIGIGLILAWGGVQLWLWRSPLVLDSETATGRVFDDVSACGHQQKNLYGCIVAFKDRHGRMPKDMNELRNDHEHDAKAFEDCPTGLSSYVVHFENLGKAGAVLIEERENRHRTALKLWLRGIRPRVQTFGDGTIHLFQGGKLATIHAERRIDHREGWEMTFLTRLTILMRRVGGTGKERGSHG